MSKQHETQVYVYGIQVLLLVILCGANGLNIENMNIWTTRVARFAVYILLMRALNKVCSIAYLKYGLRKNVNKNKIVSDSKDYIIIMVSSVTFLIYNKERVIEENFLLLFIAYLITKYPDINQRFAGINHGGRMACSFFEGYLVHVIPNDGHHFFGLENNIATYEGQHTVVFPVKTLFIVVTKSLFCPPDLKHFNKADEDLPYLEDCMSLPDVKKNVAGVVNRVYRNSAYKIHRSGRRPVYVTAECATPLHTMRRVLDQTALYGELANVDRQELVDDFCDTLRWIVQRSPEYRGKCELVYFDDEDPTQNLADVLLDKIRELEPHFEAMIDKRYDLQRL